MKLDYFIIAFLGASMLLDIFVVKDQNKAIDLLQERIIEMQYQIDGLVEFRTTVELMGKEND